MADTIFTGSSRYSNDFAAVIERSVSIASLPLRQMQSQKSTLDLQVAALRSLQTKLSAVHGNISGLEKSVGDRALTASVSGSSALQATVSTGAVEASYTLEVTNAGSATTFVATDFAGVADPSSGDYYSGASLEVTIDGGSPVVITPADRSLQSVVDAINSQLGSEVRATVVNTGTSSSPSYQISLQSKKMGGISLSISDGVVTSTSSTLGTAVQYKLNGAALTSDSRTLTVAPGLTVDVLDETGGETTVTVSRGTSELKNALETFMSSYNVLLAEVDKHRGDKSAALFGNSILSVTMNSLKNAITRNSGTGTYKSLIEIGVSFDQEGKLYLDEEIFSKAVDSNLAEVATLVGTADGSGALHELEVALDSLDDPTTGTILVSLDVAERTSRQQNERITAESERIDKLTEDLERRMTEADAMIAMLEQQVLQMTGLFEAMRESNKANR